MYRLVKASQLLKLSRLKVRNIREISVSNKLLDDDLEIEEDSGPRELGIDESWKPPRIEFDPVWFLFVRNLCSLCVKQHRKL